MQSLRNHFLLAMPHLEDPNFAGSLSYLCDHDENGTMGIIVNHPLELTLDVLLEQVDIDADECPVRDTPVYYGGPTHKDRGFIDMPQVPCNGANRNPRHCVGSLSN